MENAVLMSPWNILWCWINQGSRETEADRYSSNYISTHRKPSQHVRSIQNISTSTIHKTATNSLLVSCRLCSFWGIWCSSSSNCFSFHYTQLRIHLNYRLQGRWSKSLDKLSPTDGFYNGGLLEYSWTKCDRQVCFSAKKSTPEIKLSSNNICD